MQTQAPEAGAEVQGDSVAGGSASFAQSTDSLTVELQCPTCFQTLGIQPGDLAAAVSCPRCAAAVRGVDLIQKSQRIRVSSAQPNHPEYGESPSVVSVEGVQPLPVRPSFFARVLDWAQRWDDAIGRRSGLVVLVVAGVADACQFLHHALSVATVAFYVALATLAASLGMLLLVRLAQSRDDDGRLTLASAAQQAIGAIRSVGDEYRELQEDQDATTSDRRAWWARVVLPGGIVLAGFGALASELVPSLWPVSVAGWLLLLLAAALAWTARETDPRAAVSATLPALDAPMDGAAQFLDGRVFDLRDGAEAEMLKREVPDGYLLEALTALGNWNPRVHGGRGAHEHALRDSLQRSLARRLSDGRARVKKEFPLPATAGFTRRVDIAIDQLTIVELKKSISSRLMAEKALVQVCDYARKWNRGAVILAIADAGPTFRADLADVVSEHVARLSGEPAARRCPVFAVAVGSR